MHTYVRTWEYLPHDIQDVLPAQLGDPVWSLFALLMRHVDLGLLHHALEQCVQVGVLRRERGEQTLQFPAHTIRTTSIPTTSTPNTPSLSENGSMEPVSHRTGPSFVDLLQASDAPTMMKQ